MTASALSDYSGATFTLTIKNLTMQQFKNILTSKVKINWFSAAIMFVFLPYLVVSFIVCFLAKAAFKLLK